MVIMESLDKLVEQLGSKEQSVVYQAQQSLIRVVAEAGRPDHERERAAVAGALAGYVTATREQKDNKGKVTRVLQYPARVRVQILRWIGYVGGEAEVPALRQALDDLDTREMARWALEQIPGPSSTKALVDAAVNGIGPEFRLGAINTLGRRREPEAAAALKECAADPNIEVRLAAVEALAHFPDPTADGVMKSAMSPGGENGRVNQRLVRARIQLAETLVAAGQKDAGLRIFRSIVAGKSDETQKKAARAGLQHLS